MQFHSNVNGIQTKSVNFDTGFAILFSSGFSAASAAFITNPLEVVKVRQQNNFCFAGTTDHKRFDVNRLRFVCDCRSNMKGITSVLKTLWTKEGPLTLFNGAGKGMTTHALSAIIYYPLYELFKEELSKSTTQHKVILPLSAAISSRSITTIFLYPLEFLKTLEQAQRGHQRISLLSLVRGRQVTGFGTTLKRDLIFSSIYWLIVENVRSALTPTYTDRQSQRGNLLTNFVAGGLGGAISSLITLPLDIVKTRKQVNGKQLGGFGDWTIMRAIVRDEGFKALYLGARPRVIKSILHCGLMLSFYEIIFERLIPKF